jgi:uroporphyrinogen decarboxylase
MSESKLLIRALKGEVTERIPFWFMRQAGRYLPEYRALRATSNGFLDLCFTPEKAAEVTLQPLRRFGMDAAILFSDILVVPYALGVDVRFAEGEGPVVETTDSAARIAQLTLQTVEEKTAPVMETIRLVRKGLPEGAALIGFAGSPWTVACYMLQGDRGKAAVKEFAAARRFAYAQPALMQQLIDTLSDATIAYLRAQIDAGAEAVQLFDSWAGLLTPTEFATWSIAPTKKIVAAIRQSHPHIPVIGFAKGAATNLSAYAAQTGVDCIGIDQQTDLAWAMAQRHGNQAVQGNIDPLLVASDQPAMLAQAERILATLGQTPCVFNLGHGFVPDTPIAHVEALSACIKSYRR